MNGKTLKVAEYNLTFGASDRFVNVFGFFKYKKNSNLYIIYTDVDTKYELIYYGSSHEKNNNLLSMTCKDEDVEIIKEYIYKLTNNEPLDNFEVYNIDHITGIELISSNKLEIKLEVIRMLEELTLPKKEIKEEEIKEKEQQSKKKKKGTKVIFMLLLLIIIMGGGYFFLTTVINSDKIVKTITCKKNYPHEKISATVYETNTYNFTSNNKLNTISSTIQYKFKDKYNYESFINNGSIYNYMPESTKDFTPDAINLTIEYTTKTIIDTSYSKPTEYEEVINYYINNQYSCSENIEE